MRILMVTPYVPFPPLSGGQVRSYNLIKHLSRNHKITLFCYYRDEAEKESLGELLKYCDKVVYVKRRPAWSPLHILSAGLTFFPFLLLSTYYSPFLKKSIKVELSRGKYDLIHCETFYIMPNIPKTQIPILLVEQTIEYLVYQKFVREFKLLLLKPFMYLDIWKLKTWEKYYWKRASRLATMSEDDKKFINEVFPEVGVDVIANGVDMDFFDQTKHHKSDKPTVLFVGQFRWLPNLDAAKFLVTEVWPLIKKRIPQARLLVVGRNPTQEILDLGKAPDVSIRSDVEDIRTVYGESNVLLAPIRNGKGTKYKVLEAMATGVPIVGTPLAAEGIAITHGVHALIGNTPVELAEYTARILSDKKEAVKISKNANKLVRDTYDWGKIAAELNQVYRDIV
ncbi:hypothetical protein A2368_02105 [Candidatus Collierbacteria bacterium RIFOXYB1_FULL_49_13]|uniref:Glycosyltransferase subfamily 4-like N-terminal domain-containing protein n=1 Tax=Candidatus Collierbacteria bacterium RIFOXYB1_FULL_49_13 TaxID=1817728 RepID=A0A1F5FGH4_9BACT|nr:MAG: hypothetical protein A2368_02105 [Candidatus Collierbacteria bacterium RIFOXYB1_FULL_49_13]